MLERFSSWADSQKVFRCLTPTDLNGRHLNTFEDLGLGTSHSSVPIWRGVGWKEINYASTMQ